MKRVFFCVVILTSALLGSSPCLGWEGQTIETVEIGEELFVCNALRCKEDQAKPSGPPTTTFHQVPTSESNSQQRACARFDRDQENGFGGYLRI